MLVPETLSESIRNLFVIFPHARACERRYDHE